MEEVTIPLVGVPNPRGDAYDTIENGKDQRFINCIFSAAKNPVTGETKFYVEKRPGWGTGTVVAPSGRRCQWATTMNGGGSPLFAMSDGILYWPGSFSIGSISNVTGSTFATVNNSGTAERFNIFYNGDIYYVNSNLGNRSYTGDTTNLSAVVTNISSTANLYTGIPISGTGIPANTRILSIDSAAQITMTAAATATNAGVNLTSTPLALMLDTDILDAYTGTQVDGYLFNSSFASAYSGRIQNSNLNTVSTYSASDYLTTNESFGTLLYVGRTKDYVAAFTTKSISFYKNAGNPVGSPLKRIDEMTIDGVGLYSTGSSRNGWPAKEFNGSIYFVSNPDNGSIGVYKLTGGQLEKISSSGVDAVLSSTEASNLVINVFGFGGYDYVLVNGFGGLTSSAHNFSFICQMQTGIWSEWSGVHHTFVFNESNKGNSTVYAASIVSTSGLYWRLPTTSSDYTYQDEGAAYTMTIQTSKTDFGTDDLKSVWEVALMGSDIQSSGTATLEYSDDDYTTWVTAGTFDLTKINPRITRAGSFRGGRAWRLTHSANTAFRAQALKFKFSREAH